MAGQTGVVVLSKADVGLGNADNTADSAKPVSTAQQTALDLKLNAANPTYTGTLTGGTGVVNLGSGQFVKDGSGNVGVGTASPGAKLHVKSGATTTVAAIESTGTSVFAQLKNSGASAFLGADSTGAFQIQTPGSGYSTKLTVDASGNLGIGTNNPAAYGLLAINGASASANVNATTGAASYWLYEGAGTARGKIASLNGSNGLALFYGTTEGVRMDASGNLGLGVTPSAWNSNVKAFQFGLIGSLACRASGEGSYLSSNVYYSGDPALAGSGGTYMYSAPATSFLQADGFYKWFTAPSGTAGSPISFTQAMTLDASGKLTNNASSHNVASFNGTGGAGGYVTFESGAAVYGELGTANQIISGGSVSDFAINARGSRNLIFGTNATERARIDASGNLLIGTSSNGASARLSCYGGNGVSVSDGTFSGYIGKGSWLVSGGSASTFCVRSDTSLLFATNGGYERARIDTSGNLGLGVIPSAWGSAYKAMQIGQSALMSRSGGSDLYLLSNNYFDGTNFRYINSTLAARYTQDSGQHQWFTAPSGTAGNAISFTQVMTLDSSSNLAVAGTVRGGGRTQIGAGHIADISGSGNNQGIVFGGSAVISCTGDGTLRNGTIDLGISTNRWATLYANRADFSTGDVTVASGNLLVGTTTTDWTVHGLKLRSDIGAVVATSTNSESFLAHRIGSTGVLVNLYCTGTSVGAITSNGTGISLTSSAALGFNNGAMTLDASGKLGFADTAGLKVQLNAGAENHYSIGKFAGGGSLGDSEFRFTAGNTSGFGGAFTFSSGGTERARIDASGSLSLTGGLQQARNALSANDINLNSGNFFTKTISGATALTVSGVPATGLTASFILELTNPGSSAITWWNGVKWAGGTAPTLTASGVDILGFYTHDGGTTWRGLILAKDSK